MVTFGVMAGVQENQGEHAGPLPSPEPTAVAAGPAWLSSRWSTIVPIGVMALGVAALGLQWVTRDQEPRSETVSPPLVTNAPTFPTTSPVASVLASSAAPTTVLPATTVAAQPVTTPAPPPDTTPPTTPAPTASSAVSTPPATTAPPALTVPGPSVAPTRWAVFSGGKVYLRGVVPDDATAANVVAKAAAIVGPENVFDEYARVPGAPVPTSAPLYVADTILFGEDNAQIHSDFQDLLNLGVALLTTFPTVTATIRGHTDNVGSAVYNDGLAQRRVDAVVDYLVDRGISSNRLVGQAVGYAEPIGDNHTEAGRRLNRRIEFVITGLLDA